MPSGGTMPSGGAPSASSSSSTYQTAQEYIAHLNSTGTWVTYDATRNTARVTSLGAGRTMAERTGNATTNFIAWVTSTVAK
jgi:hypothetical protein